jgi:hypothetical protein
VRSSHSARAAVGCSPHLPWPGGNAIRRKEWWAIVDDLGSDHDIRAKMADAQGFLEALEGGNAHIGTPFEGRTEAKIQELQRQIAVYQSVIDKRRYTNRF